VLTPSRPVTNTFLPACTPSQGSWTTLCFYPRAVGVSHSKNTQSPRPKIYHRHYNVHCPNVNNRGPRSDPSRNGPHLCLPTPAQLCSSTWIEIRHAWFAWSEPANPTGTEPVRPELAGPAPFCFISGSLLIVLFARVEIRSPTKLMLARCVND